MIVIVRVGLVSAAGYCLGHHRIDHSDQAFAYVLGRVEHCGRVGLLDVGRHAAQTTQNTMVLGVGEGQPSRAQRHRINKSAGRLAHLREAGGDGEAVLERGEIESVDAGPRVDAEERRVGLELEDLSVVKQIAQGLARGQVQYGDVEFLGGAVVARIGGGERWYDTVRRRGRLRTTTAAAAAATRGLGRAYRCGGLRVGHKLARARVAR